MLRERARRLDFSRDLMRVRQHAVAEIGDGELACRPQQEPLAELRFERRDSPRYGRPGQAHAFGRAAEAVVERIRTSAPDASLTVRDLGRAPHPALDESALGALFTPADKRSADQNDRVALDDALIAELQAADVIVLGVPMYNFGVPAQLKNWIDAVARVGVTFRYTDKGPVGL